MRSSDRLQWIGALLALSSCSPVAMSHEDASSEGSAVADACVPGRAVACTCGALHGSSTCADNGAFLPCSCAAAIDAGTDAANDIIVNDACIPISSCSAGMCGAVDNGCGGTLSCPCADHVLEVDVPARHLAFDRARNVLYATVATGMYAGDVLAISPVSGLITAQIPIGPNPGALALSDDGSTLWVAIDGENAIRRADITGSGLVPGTSFPLPVIQSSPSHAEAITPLPSSTTSVAVVLNFSSTTPAAAIIDNGVDRWSIEFVSPSALVPLSADALLATGDGSSGLVLTLLRVATDGVHATQFGTLPVGLGDLVRDEGRVYAPNGRVIDIADATMPRQIGMLGYAGTLVPLPGTHRIVVLSSQWRDSSTSTHTLRLLDTDTFLQSASAELSFLTRHGVRDMMHVAPGTIALVSYDPFSTDSSVFILQNHVVGAL